MADRSLYCKNTILAFLRKKEPLFGGWKVVSFLGAGAFGCVFKLEREDLGAKFVSALKVISLTKKLNEDGASLDSLQDAISQEARELVHLYSLGGHQNVVGWHNHQIFHIRDTESVTALMAVMMDYLPNNLGKEIKKGPIPWQRALPILADCLRGLAHIHSKQVIHRDIKPENIFITQEGAARIGDFGVARQMSEQDQAETRVGTPLYIAPEVIRDPYGHGYDYQVDVYSMGLVGYEMLLGHLPFHEEAKGNKNLMVKRRLSGSPITMTGDFPKGVRDVILGAVTFDPDRRYSSAAEFLQAVERVMATEGMDTVKPLQIVRVMPESAQRAAEAKPSWLQGQEDVAPPAALASVVAADSRETTSRADVAAALSGETRSAAANASQTARRDEDEDDFDLPKRKPVSHSASATYQQPRRPSPAYSPYAQDGRSIYGVNDPYETKRRAKGFHSWEVSACFAALACVLSLHYKNDPELSSVIFLFFYVVAAVYFIIAVQASRTMAFGSFLASLLVFNYLAVGNVTTMLSAMDVVVLGIYGVAFLLAPKINALLGRG